MKQSSIEWLFEQFECLVRERNQGLIDAETFYKQKKVILKQAKEMHKQEVIDAYDKGDENGANRVYYNSDRDDKSAEQYHNETYNIKR